MTIPTPNIEDPSVFYDTWRADPRPPLERWRAMPLTWSQIYAWRSSRANWYKRYVIMEKSHTTKEMLFGSVVGDKMRFDPTFHPEVPRLTHFEYSLLASMGKSLTIKGHIDNYEPWKLGEFKTGKEAWTQKRVDEHQQIDMYLALLFLSERVKPSDVKTTLYWLPTKDSFEIEEDGTVSPIIEADGDFIAFETTRTLADIMKFLGKITQERRDMEAFILAKA